MATVAALGIYAFLLGAAAAAVWRRPITALFLFVVGLAAHNAVMAALFGAGVDGLPLTAVQAWKEILLAIALARVAWDAWRERRLPFQPAPVDLLALGFGVAVVVYALLPQDALGGSADLRARAYALRHDLIPVAAYLLGRSLLVTRLALARLGWTIAATAAAVGAIGLVEVYAVPIDWWRDSSVPAYFREQLGYDYRGTGGLPENFVYNTGSEDFFLRRLVSAFLSPLGAAYTLVVGLLVLAGGATRRRPRLALVLALVSGLALLFTFTRAAILALAGGLVVLAALRRRRWPVVAAGATLAVGVAFASVYPDVGPRGDWTEGDLAYQRAQARSKGGVGGGALDPAEPSLRSHLTSLRDGLERVVEHPQGYGLGNAGTVARRTDVPLKAGESNYTELGIETGLAGLLLFVAWNVALLATLAGAARRFAPAWPAAALAAVLALAVQTDTLGDPWLAYCVWGIAGAVAATAAPFLARAEVAAPVAAR